MLLDANLLLYAVDERSPQHARAKAWLVSAMNGDRRVGLPWQSLAAFIRIATNPRASERPLAPSAAWQIVEDWLACPTAWVPLPTPQHGHVLGALIRRYDLRGNLITDARLAALAIERGLTVYSADTDFARFSELSWVNPIAPPPANP
jgi:toxin-antitoxin system PIN domain toxin